MIALSLQISQYEGKKVRTHCDTDEKNLDEDVHILVAHPDETIRRGLRTILKEKLVDVTVSEAKSVREFQTCLVKCNFDLIIFHQSFLIPDITLPQGKFVLLATEATIEAYTFARSNGALAYLSENASPSLLQQALRLLPGAFLIGPPIASWLQDYMAQRLFLTLDVSRLTPREREIFDLYWRGANHHAIAQQLCIAESTVRSHLSHINENLSLNRNQATALSKQLSREKQER